MLHSITSPKSFSGIVRAKNVLRVFFLEEDAVTQEQDENQHAEVQREHVHQGPEQPNGEEDIPLGRRSKRSRRTGWQCLQYSSVISKEPG